MTSTERRSVHRDLQRVQGFGCCFLSFVAQARDAKEAQARQHLASLEDLRLRSAAELRDFGRELAAAGEELEKSRDAARSSEGKASKLQVVVSAWQIVVLRATTNRCVDRLVDKSVRISRG